MRRTIAIALSAMFIGTAPVAAQQATQQTDQRTGAAQSGTPVQAEPAVGAAATTGTPAAARFTTQAATKQGAAARLDNTQRATAVAEAPATTMRVRAVSQNVALMIVGGAALI